MTFAKSAKPEARRAHRRRMIRCAEAGLTMTETAELLGRKPNKIRELAQVMRLRFHDPCRLSDADLAELERLHALGLTDNQIAGVIGRPAGTVSGALRKMGRPPNGVRKGRPAKRPPPKDEGPAPVPCRMCGGNLETRRWRNGQTICVTCTSQRAMERASNAPEPPRNVPQETAFRIARDARVQERIEARRRAGAQFVEPPTELEARLALAVLLGEALMAELCGDAP